MDVILLENVENLGAIGDQVKVKSGYGRNYLLPQGKALLATAENVTRMEALRSELEGKANAELDEASARA
ncbi:MAG: 50S ribosomal protein L9, partial [Gammaproteobacteria bacterium]|nr:50S ribosomal protein L9 [Gammaproteobacteria bacterium]